MISGEIWSRCAIRNATSGRISAGSEDNSAAACDAFMREDQAIVCGCSLWMNWRVVVIGFLCTKLVAADGLHQPLTGPRLIGAKRADEHLARVVHAALQP
jgi:hypothetical protein